ncbi:ABC transporter ATP-binding protein [Halomonas elongata]|uniref:ABC transporter ATP-binding protein n=3 Tax=Halomonas TaxID=2745 RepID=E1V4V0_HALED|nr:MULTISPECIES: ABC transporter ATP-binding protein [Halomonas]MBW5800452.1 ABC transporter ATP-binding protein [Halomonas elongata]MDL4860908.1 ABC transporter ATP-binding protein [Halomonas elongata]MDR5860236.1 ABC transporter ATP-binding protein [Halomonas eurihalina]OBX35155.1 high-affinity branched-chain amino acid transport ATP-binding protein LivF [Halomonas elongata]RAW08483.1 ABC transporter ATP-binding protein [Halomonas elongata]
MPLLDARNVHGGYGGMNILNGVDMAIEANEVGVIVGPNGAGKSTMLKAIFGLLNVSQGEILLNGEPIQNQPPNQLVKRGMGFVPQEHNIFPSLTVKENLQMGAYLKPDNVKRMLARIYEFFPPLYDKRHQPAGELSGGQRQMVAMGRALMAEPDLLLLDEPTAGLSPRYMNEIFARVKEINAAGVGVLMVEQNAKQALGIADRGFVLAAGQNRFTDTGAALLADPDVAKSFLGG